MCSQHGAGEDETWWFFKLKCLMPRFARMMTRLVAWHFTRSMKCYSMELAEGYSMELAGVL